jgi:hypothetical protein
MNTSLAPTFYWRESPHDGDPFKVNPHRTAHTLYYAHHPIARIEPSGLGLAARFLDQTIDTPGRAVAVPTVKRGKVFVENWIRARETSVVAAYQEQQFSFSSGPCGESSRAGSCASL